MVLLLNDIVCILQDFIEFVQIQSVLFHTIVPQGTNTSTDLVILSQSYPVEQCQCPEQYTGSSCQECSHGYFRVSGDPTSPCVPCNCSGLSLDCNANTGICIDCMANSEGDHCERCQTGYYGDPTRGIPCLPCPCPTVVNSFSATCFLDFDLNATCDSCILGYTGRNCEFCMDNFFGNPYVSYFVSDRVELFSYCIVHL